MNGIRDVDGDSVPDVLASSIEERVSDRRDGEIMCGHLSVWSGRDGKLIRAIDAPYREEIYIPLQVSTQYDGNEMILIATGGQSAPGGIYMLPLSALMDASKQNSFIEIYRNPTSGFIVPLVLSDLNDDGVEDIVAALFNSTVLAFDGKTFEMLWNHTFSESETISAIVPGRYNHDNVTDFMVKYNSGPGFPIYYYSQTQILDGRNGTALLDKSINDAGGSNSLLAGLSLSQTYGGDFFLHWQVQCQNKVDAKEPYQFIPGNYGHNGRRPHKAKLKITSADSDIRLQTRADTCMLRYNASTVLQLHAISRHVESPGPVVFTTDELLLQLNQTELKQLEKQFAVPAMKHPKVLNIRKMAFNANATVAKKSAATATAAPLQVASSKFSEINQQKALSKSSKKLARPEQAESHFRKKTIANFEKPLFSEQSNQMDVPLSPENVAAKIETASGREENIEQEMNYLMNTIKENRNRMMIEEQMDPRPPETAPEDFVLYEDPEEERAMAYGAGARDARSKKGETGTDASNFWLKRNLILSSFFRRRGN